ENWDEGLGTSTETYESKINGDESGATPLEQPSAPQPEFTPPAPNVDFLESNGNTAPFSSTSITTHHHVGTCLRHVSNATRNRSVENSWV
ncbi:MAG: hypothetical protein MR708_05535, partial [Bacteroidales bacterium]|nr:hypothetical protein [Bacteroidales bacterium]